ncbi:MAG TPA: GNAT family N-acetyltransferase [Alphaproteobacteria bacterium]|nr:GNAT family N-acetyltransferase [Alphaproteobacteria bacterium]
MNQPCAYRIRPGLIGEIEALRDIERLAAERFAALGMDDIAASEPTPADLLAKRIRQGRNFVAADAGDQPVGSAIFSVVDGCAHVEQLDVLPAHAGRRLGARLIDRVADWAVGQGLGTLTLTTFATVPWNGPYYGRLGFAPVDPADLGSGLAAIRDAERERGLDTMAARICMARPARRA